MAFCVAKQEKTTPQKTFKNPNPVLNNIVLGDCVEVIKNSPLS